MLDEDEARSMEWKGGYIAESLYQSITPTQARIGAELGGQQSQCSSGLWQHGRRVSTLRISVHDHELN